MSADTKPRLNYLLVFAGLLAVLLVVIGILALFRNSSETEPTASTDISENVNTTTEAVVEEEVDTEINQGDSLQNNIEESIETIDQVIRESDVSSDFDEVDDF